MRLPRLVAVILALVLSLGLPNAEAQAPARVVIIAHITGPHEAPIDHAMLRVTNPAGGLVALARSDSAGAIRLRLADPGTALSVTVTAIGYAPFTATVPRERIARGPVELGTISLRQLVIQLPATRVVERPRPRPPLLGNGGQFSGGASGQRVTLSSLSGNDEGDVLANLATLPGVTLTGGGFSVLGLDPDQNTVLLGGLPFSGLSVPRDLFGTITFTMATADAAVSGFSGAMVSISPGAVAGRDARMRVTAEVPQLRWDRRTGLSGTEYSNVQVSGVVTGGDAHRIYGGAWQVGQRSVHASTLTSVSPGTLGLVGLDPDSAARIADITRSLGFQVEQRTPTSMHRNASGLAAIFSYPRSDRSITTLAGLSVDVDEGASSGPFALGAPAMAVHRLSGMLSLRYSRYFRDVIFHSQRLGVSVRRSGARARRLIPAAAVDVVSADASGSTGITRVTVGGGGPALPDATDWDAQWEDEMNWLSRSGREHFRIRAYSRLSGFRSTPAPPPATFIFQSPGEFAAGRAARYSRAFPPAIANRLLTTNLSFTTTWEPRSGLQITGGAAAEGARYLGAPGAARAVVDRFQLDGVGTPAPVTLSPRIGATWSFGRIPPRMLSGPGEALDSWFTLGGSFGSYRASMRVHSLDAAIASTQAPRFLDCVAAAAPPPDWAAYLASISDAPDACVDGSAPVLATSAPTIALFERGYQPPVSNRINVFLRAKTSPATSAFLHVTRSSNRHQPGRTDRNLVPNPRFTIADEAGRPSFTDPQAIVAATGIAAPASGRLDPAYGSVFVIGSGLRSSSTQLMGTLTRRGTRGGPDLSLSYTLLMGREQANGYRGTTAGDPRAIEWQPLAADGRQAWTLQLHWSFHGSDVQLFGRAASGVRYTPRVAGDVNGDAVADDRAFVFDPATVTDTAVARGMSDLLGGAPSHAQRCLRSQIGRIAAPNSCHGPWMATLNAKIQLHPRLFTATERFGLALSFTNLLAGADLLLHGSARAHGWGQSAMPDPTLLSIRGFDPAVSRFTYLMNPRFGSTRSQLAAFWNPARVTLELQANVGPNPRRRRIEVLVHGGRGYDTRASEGDILNRLSRVGPTALGLVTMRPNLHWSRFQRDSVQSIRTTLLSADREALQPLARYLAHLPDGYSTREVEARIRSEIAASARRYAIAVAALRDLMSEEQIDQLDLYLRPELDPSHVYEKRLRFWY